MICNGTAISPKNMTVSSSNNHVNNSKLAEVSTNAVMPPAQPPKPSPTKSLQVTMKDFDLLKVLGTGAYGKVFLARKRTGVDAGTLFAMKVLKKATIVQKKKTTEHTKTERQVLQTIRQSPFLVTMHYAFQTPSKLHLVLDYVNGGELFTHLYQREKVTLEQSILDDVISLILSHKRTN